MSMNDADDIQEDVELIGTTPLYEEEDGDELVATSLPSSRDYTIPDFKGGLVNPTTNVVEEEKPLTAWEVIQQMASVTGAVLKDSPNTGCKKCFGRGYVGRDTKTKAPIPCSCIFVASSPMQKAQENNIASSVGFSSMSREQRRRLAKKMYSINKRKRYENNDE